MSTRAIAGSSLNTFGGYTSTTLSLWNQVSSNYLSFRTDAISPIPCTNTCSLLSSGWRLSTLDCHLRLNQSLLHNPSPLRLARPPPSSPTIPTFLHSQLPYNLTLFFIKGDISLRFSFRPTFNKSKLIEISPLSKFSYSSSSFFLSSFSSVIISSHALS